MVPATVAASKGKRKGGDPELDAFRAKCKKLTRDHLIRDLYRASKELARLRDEIDDLHARLEEDPDIDR